MEQWIKTYILKNYYVRKIFPFYVMALLIECAQKIYLLVQYPNLFDWHWRALCKTFGIAVIETTVGFSYIALILLVLFMMLPVQKQNHTSDKRLTVFLFYLVVFVNYLEDVVEVIQFELTQTSIVRQTVRSIISHANTSPFGLRIICLLGLVACMSWVYTVLWKSALFPVVRIPVIHYRLRYVSILLLVLGLITLGFNQNTWNKLSNPYNNELAKDGMLTIIQMIPNK